ncbi:MAG TPA: LacI family DNA-binding transcriptional regulator [Chthoniobacteraceae bacterium]|nr:LacI family DNA-binding transcriptional regulator [Chthoniobacteraceae bacterium]
MITQTQLSAILGVHQSTISGVLNDRPKVRASPETRRRILEAAEKYGYKPSLHARTLRQGRSGLVGVLNFVGIGATSAEKQMRTVQALQESGFRPVVNEVFDVSHAVESLELLMELKVEGLVLKSVPHSIAGRLWEVVRKESFPVVAMDGASLPGLPWIHAKKHLGMRELTLYLIEQGYRRLALLPRSGEEDAAMPPNIYSHPNELIRGFQMAVEASADRLEEVEVIRRVLPKVGAPYEQAFHHGRILTEQLIAERKTLPQVLLCNDDDWALGAMSACFEAGLRVPGDVAITGFDNTRAGQFSPIPLTTVSQPADAMATKAVEVLRKLIGEGRKPTRRSIAVDGCEVVARKSTAAMGQVDVGKIEIDQAPGATRSP